MSEHHSVETRVPPKTRFGGQRATPIGPTPNTPNVHLRAKSIVKKMRGTDIAQAVGLCATPCNF